jgi:hypothetical protein
MAHVCMVVRYFTRSYVRIAWRRRYSCDMPVSLVWAFLAMSAADDLSTWKLIRVLTLGAATKHVQGIDVDGDTLWVSSVDRTTKKGFLSEFSLSDGKFKRSIELQDGDRFHPGGIATDATSIWIPVAEYRAHSSAVIQKRNKKTLTIEAQFDVADHIGCVAVTPDSIVGGNWDSRQFYVWDRSGKLLRKVDNAAGNGYQDIKYVSGQIVASGLLAGKNGAIDWLEWPWFQMIRRVTAGKTDSGVTFTQEGMTVRGNELMLLPEDDRSRLFVFRIP